MAARPAESSKPAPDRLAGLEIDPRTGRRYLRLPVADPHALAKLADALSGLLARVNKG